MTATDRTRYEWLVETVDEHGDILDVSHWDSFREARRDAGKAIASGCKIEIGLVRDVFEADNNDELDSREWAYLENGKLPATFTDGTQVPKRFSAEVSRAKASGIDDADRALKCRDCGEPGPACDCEVRPR